MSVFRATRTAAQRPRAARAHRRCSRPDDDSGAALVEFALVFPIFVMMLLGMVQLGLSFAGWSSLTASVQTGARMASVVDAGSSPAACPALGSGYPPGGPGPGEVVATDTARMICEIASLIGTPVGTTATGANPVEIGLLVDSAGSNGSTVTVCAAVPASDLTGFLPSYTLHAASTVYAEVPDIGSDLETWNPYGLSSCGQATGG